MEIKKSFLKNASILYLSISVICFLLLWCRWYVSLISIICTVFIAYRFIVCENKNKESIYIDKKWIAVILLVILSWCILGGQGGFYYQSPDWSARNAIFRKMIFSETPVFFSEGYFLCYYIGHWMVPNVIGKILIRLGASAEMVWSISNICLLIYTMIGVTLAFFLVISFLKRNKKRDLILLLSIFILFSGLDIVGYLIRSTYTTVQSFVPYHIEWWNDYPQFSSNTTQLFWVFNQAVPAWVTTMLFIDSDNIKKDGFIGTMLLLFSPLPIFGCAVLVFGKIIQKYILRKKIKSFFKDLFTVDNMLSFLIILPIIASYILANTRISQGEFTSTVAEVNFFAVILSYALFLMLECGIYLIFVYKEYKRSYLFYTVLCALPIIGCISLGNTYDFQMRASIPLLFVLMVMVMDVLLKGMDERGKKNAYKMTFLIIVLLIGSITPLIEFYRGIDYVITHPGEPLVYEAELSDSSTNFVAPNYYETVFGQYFGQ